VCSSVLGLWTFAVIEIADVFRVILNPSAILEALSDGVIAALIELALNQVSNLIAAFVWFGYWGEDGILAWLLVAYAGYWIGVGMARRGKDLPIQGLMSRLRSLRP